jgi:hypothetical protein
LCTVSLSTGNYSAEFHAGSPFCWISLAAVAQMLASSRQSLVHSFTLSRQLFCGISLSRDNYCAEFHSSLVAILHCFTLSRQLLCRVSFLAGSHCAKFHSPGSHYAEFHSQKWLHRSQLLASKRKKNIEMKSKNFKIFEGLYYLIKRPGEGDCWKTQRWKIWWHCHLTLDYREHTCSMAVYSINTRGFCSITLNKSSTWAISKTNV